MDPLYIKYFAKLLGALTLVFLGQKLCAGIVLKKAVSNRLGLIVIAFRLTFAVFLGIISTEFINEVYPNLITTIRQAIAEILPWNEGVPLCYFTNYRYYSGSYFSLYSI